MLNVIQNGKQLTLDANGNLNINLAAGSISGGNAAAGLTGVAVPLSGDYLGVNIAGTLTGVTGFSLVNSKPAAVAIVDASGNQVTSFGGGTQYSDGTTQATPTGTAILGKNASNVLHTLVIDGSGNLNVNIAASTGMSVTQGTTPWVDNISQFGGNAVVTGTGTSGIGIPRVTVSNDSNILATQSGTWNIGTITALTGITNTVNVSVLNASLAVTGTFFQATQPVSSLQLPVALDGSGFLKVHEQGTATVTGSVSVSNFPSTQPVSLSGTTLIGGLNGLITTPISVNSFGGLLISDSGGLSDLVTQLLLETRASRHVLMSIACESGKYSPQDFYPGSFQTEIISESVLN